MDSEVLEQAREILRKAADEMGVELLSVRYLETGENGPTLEVRIDKDYAIDMATIEAYTDKVNPLLDALPESEGYVLDIASGGSERLIPYEDLGKLVGRYLDLELVSGEKVPTAKLLAEDEAGIEVLYFIKGRKKDRKLRKDEVASIHMGYKA